MRPKYGGSGDAVFSNAISKFVDSRSSTLGGGGAKTANKWYPKRLNETVTDDLSSYIERVTHDIATFTVADPGSVVITGVDVTALYPAGRMCDIRDPNHTGGNDTLLSTAPYIVATSVFAAGDTTINFSATAAHYSYGPIIADVVGNSIISSGLFKCLISGDFIISASGECFEIDESGMRLVNVDGFEYNITSGAVDVQGGTVFDPDLYARQAGTTGQAVIADQVVALVAGEYYELQQYANDALASDTAWGYPRINFTDASEPASYAYLSIERYTP